MPSLEQSPLGRVTDYSDQYSPELLFPVARSTLRAELGVSESLPFHGVDIWNAYEISWLDPRGKPRIALGRFSIPATTPNIVESKSLKLYLNSFNQTRFAEPLGVHDAIERDLAHACGAPVQVALCLPENFGGERLSDLVGDSIDDMEIDATEYTPAPALLFTHDQVVSEQLVSNLLRSTCPITGQPDWASILVAYRGRRIDRESLLRYLISFRLHGGFHEHCVERIFVDVQTTCRPHELTVYARYLRRGGLDINPFRTTNPSQGPVMGRSVRQ